MSDRPVTIVDSEQALFQGGTKHQQRMTCPGCNDQLNRVALVDLLYVFTACDCDKLEYGHLYEQMWHRGCFVEGLSDE